MLFTYNKESKEIIHLPETNFQKHKILERQDIEKWVENYPEILGEELLIITTEYDKFDKTDERLDLLALDKEGNLVVIELKRDDSGSTVDLQAIKYASYVSTLSLPEVERIYQSFLEQKGRRISTDQAHDEILAFIENEEFEEINDKPRIIIVSREFRPEVIATILWLRKFQVNIKCVKLTPYDLNKSLIALESSVIIPLPEAEDYIISSEQKESSEGTATVTQEEYVKFYKELVSRIRKNLPISYRDPKPFNYYQISTPISSSHFEWAFHGRPRSSFGVELHFEKSDKEKNLLVFSKLEQMKDEINKEFGMPLIFQKDWGKNWARIYVEKKEGKMTEELKVWAVENMTKLYNILNPILEKIKKEI